MSDKQLVMVEPSVWEAIHHRAAAQRVSVERWLRQQVELTADASTDRQDGGDEVLLELAVRHFRDLHASDTELRRLAAAMFASIDHGEAGEVGPLGRRGLRYRIQRRTDCLQIRVGQGAIRLPIANAIRLATLLHGAEHLELVADMAA